MDIREALNEEVVRRLGRDYFVEIDGSECHVSRYLGQGDYGPDVHDLLVIELADPDSLDRLWAWVEGVQRGVPVAGESGGGARNA